MNDEDRKAVVIMWVGVMLLVAWIAVQLYDINTSLRIVAGR